jgi:hypothetical protein
MIQQRRVTTRQSQTAELHLGVRNPAQPPQPQAPKHTREAPQVEAVQVVLQRTAKEQMKGIALNISTVKVNNHGGCQR